MERMHDNIAVGRNVDLFDADDSDILDFGVDFFDVINDFAFLGLCNSEVDGCHAVDCDVDLRDVDCCKRDFFVVYGCDAIDFDKDFFDGDTDVECSK